MAYTEQSIVPNSHKKKRKCAGEDVEMNFDSQRVFEINRALLHLCFICIYLLFYAIQHKILYLTINCIGRYIAINVYVYKTHQM